MVRLVADRAGAERACRKWHDAKNVAVMLRVAIKIDDGEKIGSFMCFVSRPDDQSFAFAVVMGKRQCCSGEQNNHHHT